MASQYEVQRELLWRKSNVAWGLTEQDQVSPHTQPSMGVGFPRENPNWVSFTYDFSGFWSDVSQGC